MIRKRISYLLVLMALCLAVAGGGTAFAGDSPKRPVIAAHRGASRVAPENTLASMMKAVELGADMVELDVYLSSDGKLVLMHDETVDRTTNGKGSVSGYTTAELKALDAGSWFSPAFKGEGVPTLAGVLASLPPAMGVNVEVKVPKASGGRTALDLAAALDRELTAYAVGRDIVVSSFDFALLEEIHCINPDLFLAYLYTWPQWPPTLEKRMRSGVVRAINPYHAFLTKGLVRKAHSLGIQVHAWTVDSPQKIRKLAEVGIDGIITNEPDKAIGALASAK